ncbi:MAG: rubredoxin, partial [Nodosilinea sp.]
MSTESEPTANSPEPVDVVLEGSEMPEADSSEAVVLSPQDMDRYECRACGYSYEPTKGDSQAKIPVGVAFEDLPLNWRCPVCSASKKQFSN